MKRSVQALLSLLVAIFAQASAAETRTLEVVGTIPIGPSKRASVAPRDAAIDQALREAVVRVAQEFLADRVIEEPAADELKLGLIERENLDSQPSFGFGDEAGSEPLLEAQDELAEALASDGPDLEQILGKKMVPYTLRFRVIEDRGRRPALFAEDPEVREEYVVIVEVQLDVDRIQAKLVGAGLILPGDGAARAHELRLEIEGLSVYPAYLAIRELLVGALGAKGVYPVELARGRTVLDIETPASAVEFLEQLLVVAPPEIEIVPLHAAGNRVHVIANWISPAQLKSEGEIEGKNDAAAGPARSRLRRH